MKIQFFSLFILLFSLLSGEVHGMEEKKNKVFSRTPKSSSAESTSLYLNWFQLGSGAMFDSDGGLAGISGLNWNPTLMLNKSWRTKLSLGGILANLGTGSTFFIGESIFSLVAVTQSPFWFEVGGGYQYWQGRGGFQPQARGGIAYRLKVHRGGIFEPIHTLHLSYTVAPLKQITAHQVLLSLVFKI